MAEWRRFRRRFCGKKCRKKEKKGGKTSPGRVSGEARSPIWAPGGKKVRKRGGKLESGSPFWSQCRRSCRLWRIVLLHVCWGRWREGTFPDFCPQAARKGVRFRPLFPSWSSCGEKVEPLRNLHRHEPIACAALPVASESAENATLFRRSRPRGVRKALFSRFLSVLGGHPEAGGSQKWTKSRLCAV